MLRGRLALLFCANLLLFEANRFRFSSAFTGDQLEAIILFIDTADEFTSRLIMFQDTGVTGMPLTPDGNNVQIVVGANGWFTL